ncbi:hypothetical protein KCU63_g56, partial [Aureobasidium melanogenum]
MTERPNNFVMTRCRKQEANVPFLLFSGKTSFGGGVAFVASMTLCLGLRRRPKAFHHLWTYSDESQPLRKRWSCSAHHFVMVFRGLGVE